MLSIINTKIVDSNHEEISQLLNLLDLFLLNMKVQGMFSHSIYAFWFGQLYLF